MDALLSRRMVINNFVYVHEFCILWRYGEIVYQSFRRSLLCHRGARKTSDSTNTLRQVSWRGENLKSAPKRSPPAPSISSVGKRDAPPTRRPRARGIRARP